MSPKSRYESRLPVHLWNHSNDIQWRYALVWKLHFLSYFCCSSVQFTERMYGLRLHVTRMSLQRTNNTGYGFYKWYSGRLNESVSYENLLRSFLQFCPLSMPIEHSWYFDVECSSRVGFFRVTLILFLFLIFPPPQWLTHSYVVVSLVPCRKTNAHVSVLSEWFMTSAITYWPNNLWWIWLQLWQF